MARGRTLSLKVETEVKGLDKLDKLGDKLARTGKIMSAAVTVPLVAAGAAAIKFASDLEQSTMKAQQVFTTESDKIAAAAKNMDDSFSEATFLDTAGTFGALLQNMGLVEEEAANLSLEWLGLSEDMASFHNTNPEEALGAIQSALAGEFEPLKRYGVMLNVARIEQAALEAGIWDGVGALTDQERILAINTELFRQQPKVLGDAARSSDTLAEKQRELAADFEDAAASLGESLLPVATDAVDTIGDLVQEFAELPDPVKDTVVQFAALLAVVGPFLFIGGKVLNLVKDLAPAFGALRTAMGAGTAGGFLAGLGTAGAVGGGLAVLTSEWLTAVENITGHPIGEILEEAWGDPELEPVEVPAPDLSELDDFGTRHIQPWIDNEVIPTMSTGADNAASVFAEVLGEAPQRGADELLANQFVLGTALQELTDYMEQSLTPAQQMFNAQGFLQSQELANGLVSNNPYVRTKAQEMQAAAIAALNENLQLAMDAGMNLASTYAAGIVNNLGVVADAGRQLAWNAARPITVESEPPDPLSPLRGITQWGGNIAKTLAQGMLSGTETVTAAARGMVTGITDPTIAAPRPGRSSGVVGGIVGGNVTNINLTFTGDPPDSKDERELVATLQRLAPFIDGKLAPGY